MKTKVYNLILSISFIMFFSCSSDFLELYPKTNLTSDSFYETELQMTQAVNAAYRNLQTLYNGAFFIEEVRSDNTTVDYGLSLGGLQVYLPVDQFYMYSDDPFILSTWRTIYRALNDINIPLSKLEGANFDTEFSTHIEGELKFLRAFFHFKTVQYWGDAPILLEPITSPAAAMETLRDDKELVIKAIKTDLIDAIAKLPVFYEENDSKGRANKGAAHILLAKVYLLVGDYQSAEAELRAVEKLGYKLLDDYKSIFDPVNKNNNESIFEVQYMEGDHGLSSSFMYRFAPRNTVTVVPEAGQNGGGVNIPTKDLIALYDTANDVRYKTTIGFDMQDTKYLGYDSTFSVPYVKKYNFPHATNGQTGVNWPVFRYADVLLMLAEVVNKQAYNPGESLGYLNQVRNRAGVTLLTQSDAPDQESMCQVIATERRLELAFENHRWFDLVRTGKALEVMTVYGQKELANPTTPINPVSPISGSEYQIESFELLYPIPVQEIIINPNLTQNPGYN